jgi:hypothetical protein
MMANFGTTNKNNPTRRTSLRKNPMLNNASDNKHLCVTHAKKTWTRHLCVTQRTIS